MSEDIQNGPATKQPNSASLRKAGSTFIPMEILGFWYPIHLPESASPDDPKSLFTLYYSPEIIDQIVDYTNECFREPRGPKEPHCVAHNWYPTYAAEIYVYLCIRIYMTLIIQNEIQHY
jgi:hypothetical protein